MFFGDSHSIIEILGNNIEFTMRVFTNMQVYMIVAIIIMSHLTSFMMAFIIPDPFPGLYSLNIMTPYIEILNRLSTSIKLKNMKII